MCLKSYSKILHRMIWYPFDKNWTRKSKIHQLIVSLENVQPKVEQKTLPKLSTALHCRYVWWNNKAIKNSVQNSYCFLRRCFFCRTTVQQSNKQIMSRLDNNMDFINWRHSSSNTMKHWWFPVSFIRNNCEAPLVHNKNSCDSWDCADSHITAEFEKYYSSFHSSQPLPLRYWLRVKRAVGNTPKMKI